MYKFFIFLFNILLIFLIFNNLYSISDDNLNSGKISIKPFCLSSLEYYTNKPQLETEYLRRLEYCINTSKDISPEGFKVNPIISDFRSQFGVNGRTRMTLHQGVDIIGRANQSIIAIADGVVLETVVKDCIGPTLVINHGKSFDKKDLITIYSHTGEFLVKEGDNVKRGSIIAKLPKKIEYPCMARVRHLHLQIGQQYCEKHEKGTWGCDYFIKDLYNSLNPHMYWANGPNNIACFEKNKKYPKGTITYPFECKKITN